MPDRSDHDSKSCDQFHHGTSHSNWLLSEHDNADCEIAHRWCTHATWRHDQDVELSQCYQVHLTKSHRAWSVSEHGKNKGWLNFSSDSKPDDRHLLYNEHKGVKCESYHPEYKYFGNDFGSHSLWKSDNRGLTSDECEQEHFCLPCQIEHPQMTHQKWFGSYGQSVDIQQRKTGDSETNPGSSSDRYTVDQEIAKPQEESIKPLFQAALAVQSHDGVICRIEHPGRSHSQWKIDENSDDLSSSEIPSDQNPTTPQREIAKAIGDSTFLAALLNNPIVVYLGVMLALWFIFGLVRSACSPTG